MNPETPGIAGAADDSASNPPSNYTGRWLDQVRFNDAGLVTAVAQDAASGRLLMLAWMNREALLETVATGRAVYWSRSRAALWRKGEESGNVQRVREVQLDCDGDAIVLLVDQHGGVACHTGRQSCFFRVLTDGQWVSREPVLKDPALMYGAGADKESGDV